MQTVEKTSENMSKVMNVLLLGSGGRESAIAWKLAQSPLLGRLYVAPGNAGTAVFGTNVALKPLDFPAVADFVRSHDISLIFVGNEDPLVAGIYDYMQTACPDVLTVGPSKAAAQLEGSKDFAKGFMMRHGIPTAAYRSFTAETAEAGCEFLGTLSAPYVLKADGLAAGKGVLIVDNPDEARADLRDMLTGRFGAAGNTVVIEEFLSGIECSVFVITDGNGGYRILPVAKDYKRIGEGDTGLNTGGMGAVSPVCFADAEFMRRVEERIVRPTVDGLRDEGLVYRGIIFLGLINCGGDPKVIEYNVRFGDPETEVVMLRLKSDLLELVAAAAAGNLGELKAEHDPRAAATVMAVSAGYPGSYTKGKVITGNLFPVSSIVFHAGTRRDDDGLLLTSGGRVLTVSSYGDTLAEALQTSYRSLEDIHFDGLTRRRDIGRDVLALEK